MDQNSVSLHEMAKRAIEESIAIKQRLLETEVPKMVTAAERIARALRAHGKLVLFGNGGSAADAQHIAAELVGRFERERRPLPAMALTTNTSTLTAIANDDDYAQIFSRQVAAWVKPEDVVAGISTSGNSANVIEGIKTAKRLGATTIGLTGVRGGKLADCVDLCLCVPSSQTARIQESHILIGHVICQLIETDVMGLL